MADNTNTPGVAAPKEAVALSSTGVKCASFDSKTYTVLGSEIKDLHSTIERLKDQSREQDKRIKKLEGLVGHEEEEETHSRNKRGIRWRRVRTPEIGFLVSLATDQLPVKRNDVLKFDHVITNIGNAFDRESGKFVCRIPGTYMFYFNLVSEIESYIEASIKVNGITQVTAVSNHRITTGDQGSAVAILILRRGDVVAVNIDWPVEQQIVHGEGKTTFSGYLLQRHRRLRDRNDFLVQS